MECTQRLECTQDVYDTYCEKTCPEQIGFLGICGSKHPIKKGPNKIGRDPQTCHIVLNDNSISRQHAVINILSKNNFMLMDLDSSNKTKLLNKTLQPYIAHPLTNGDTVQFGAVFGIFRLLEEPDDLPLTQAGEIPDTPINTRQISKLKVAPITTVPESPDVSDRDDSVIATSQPKKTVNFKSSNNNFLKSSKNMKAIQQIGTNKIDNVYWNSSKKSDSFSSNYETNSRYSINKSSVSPKELTIESSLYDMETQAPAVPNLDKSSTSIFEANTEHPTDNLSPTVYSCETQIPKLPEVFKIQNQNNVQLNLYSTNKNFNIFDAETQVTLQNKEKQIPPKPASAVVHDDQDCDAVSAINKKLNSSDEEISFHELDCQEFEEESMSQPLLPPDPHALDYSVTPMTTPNKIINNDLKDCDKTAPSQVVNIAKQSSKVQNDSDETDCEEELSKVTNVCGKEQPVTVDDDTTDCEDDDIPVSQNRSKSNTLHQSFEDLPTQVIEEKILDKEKNLETENVPFEEMLTQVIEECPIENNTTIEEVKENDKPTPIGDLQTGVTNMIVPQKQSNNTPIQTTTGNNHCFKLPLSSPKMKNTDSAHRIKSSNSKTVKNSNLRSEVEDENYYAATQQIFDDLCSQQEIGFVSDLHTEKNHTSTKNTLVQDRSSEDSDATDRINSFVSNLTKNQVREVIGADVHVAPLNKKKSSDSSDFEVTPKKFNHSKFLLIDLPNTQEIKSCDFVTSNIDCTSSSDGSDTRENDEDSPRKSSRTGRKKKDIKVDLMKKFGNPVPTRAITRIRKPTSKMIESDGANKKLAEKKLHSNLGLHKKHEIDEDAIQSNFKRLRNKTEKSNTYKNSTKDEKDVLLKKGHSEQSSLKGEKNKTKERVKPQLNEKELKQRDIKSMLQEHSSKKVTAAEGFSNFKTEPVEPRRSRQSSRNRNKEKNSNLIELEVPNTTTKSSERKKSNNQSHSNAKIKESIDLTIDSQTVVRRSKRHQTSKDKVKDKTEHRRKKESRDSKKSENIRTTEKINTHLNREHSTVYNLSSETAVDSPNNLKRQATSDILSSNAKKAKSSNAVNASVRSNLTRGVRTQYVLFTAFPSEEVKLKLEKLGAVVVSDVKLCTVVLTLQLRRTFKLLCALGLGKPIVGPNWVQACADSNMIVDPWLYLIRDEATEKRFGFNLRQSLTCKRNFLKGYNVFCTPSVSPNAQEMKLIVECSGGTWREGGRNWFCVSCLADKALWPGLRKRGATIVSTEFILGGVLQQRMSLDRDRLK